MTPWLIFKSYHIEIRTPFGRQSWLSGDRYNGFNQKHVLGTRGHRNLNQNFLEEGSLLFNVRVS